MICIQSIEIGWNGKPDYPEFTNAFIESAYDIDGRELSAGECQKWEEDNAELFYEIVYESLIP